MSVAATVGLPAVGFSSAGFAALTGGLSFLKDLDAHRQAMLRFARRKVRDEDLAEDAVQDALIAAMNSAGSFQGQSTPRTWLMGILNHKIQDAFRRETRYVRIGDVSGRGSEDGESFDDASAFDSLENSDHAANPMKLLSDKRMGLVLRKEIEALPESQREVVRLHLIEGLSTAEVCAELGISEANCWVRIHRARKTLANALRNHLDA